MRTEAAIERLGDHQATLRTLLEESAAALEGAVPDTVVLAGLRWRFRRALGEYQLFKHTELFDPLIRSADPDRSRAAVALKHNCLELGRAYDDHLRRWALGGSDGPSADYLREARGMVRRTVDHLNREAAGVRRLLAGVERTRRA